MTTRTLCASIITFLLLTAPSTQAQQMSRSERARHCSQLEGQLASLQRARHTRSSKNFQKYDAAIHKQIAQLDNANQLAKRDSCTGSRGFLFRRTPKATCPSLMKRIDKMKRNLRALEKKRSKYAPPPQNTGQQKAAIVRELARARCGEQYERFADVAPARPQRRGLFGALFGGRAVVREYPLQDYDIPSVGTYRTVCVRSCDGYFFPVSFSTTQGNFARDDGICKASCPGSDVELYTYKNPGETPEDMRSLGGRPYKGLETAFLYQKEYVKNCSCQAPQSQLTALTKSDQPPKRQISLSKQANIAANNAMPHMPLPMPKNTASLDPDTWASQRLGLPFEPYKPPKVSSAKGVVKTADGRSIRIVGPKFFGTPE